MPAPAAATRPFDADVVPITRPATRRSVIENYSHAPAAALKLRGTGALKGVRCAAASGACRGGQSHAVNT